MVFVNIVIVNLWFSEKDNRTASEVGDSDSGKGSSLVNSYGSTNSLNSSSSTLNIPPYPPPDSAEQFEVLKQTKELWEAGIEL